MDFTWKKNPQSATGSAVDHVVLEIQRALKEKALNPGDQLPTEGELAEQLHVSRSTVREAIKILQAYGVVEVFQGRGSFISKKKEGISRDAILFRYIMLQPDEDERWAFRELFERHVTANAIRTASPDDIAKLKANIEEMRASQDDGVKCTKLDLAFHQLLNTMEKNSMIRSAYEISLDFLEPYFALNHSIPGHAKKTIAVHELTVKAIEERNSDAVEDIITASKNAYVTGLERHAGSG